MRKKKALIGMSGGVDSSVSAYRMLQLGYDCDGCTMLLHSSGCGGSEDASDAAAVAEKLDIGHFVLECRQEFESAVISRFAAAYEAGLTPNPCICCNFSLKFGAMLEKALVLGYDAVVSGHYARIRFSEASGRYLLYKAADHAKDQTYFLAGLNQHQLSHILFPLGDLTKAEVRAIAEAQGFVCRRG